MLVSPLLVAVAMDSYPATRIERVAYLQWEKLLYVWEKDRWGSAI